VAYEDPEGGEIYVIRLCPNCGRFIRKGELLTNLLGGVLLKNWMCKKCGEVQPLWDRL
jgi:ribosomal protein S27AE